jgi:hypothetical protein
MKTVLKIPAFLFMLFISIYATAQPPVKEIFPDLAISDFRITSISTTEVKYTCTITNIGDQVAFIPAGVALNVKFYSNLDNAQKNLSGPTLAAGGVALNPGQLGKGKSVTVNFKSTDNFSSYQICMVTLDEYKKVAGESNRANNTRFAIVPLP